MDTEKMNDVIDETLAFIKDFLTEEEYQLIDGKPYPDKCVLLKQNLKKVKRELEEKWVTDNTKDVDNPDYINIEHITEYLEELDLICPDKSSKLSGGKGKRHNKYRTKKYRKKVIKKRNNKRTKKSKRVKK